jgi:hypothetical protein
MKVFVFLLLVAWMLGGCAAGLAVIGAGAGAAAGAGVEHTISGITYRTFATPAEEMRLSTLATLERMEMEVLGEMVTEEGFHITASANQRAIEIDLERLSAGTTRMRVVAHRGEIFFKDRATAQEIVLQTASIIEERKPMLAAQAIRAAQRKVAMPKRPPVPRPVETVSDCCAPVPASVVR